MRLLNRILGSRWFRVLLVAAACYAIVLTAVATWNINTDDGQEAARTAPTAPQATEHGTDTQPATREQANAAEATAAAFVGAYLDPGPRWRTNYTAHTTTGLADRLSTVPRTAVTPATVRDVEAVSVGVGYAVVHVTTSTDTLRVTLVRNPDGWAASSVMPA